MAEAVRAAFGKPEHLIVEAGTGVGKSFAYLLPAIERAVEHQQRVVISTRTIALQEQLIHKDIPFLQSVIGDKFSAVLVKGRSNYVGLRRLTIASRKQDRLFADAGLRSELWRIEDWAMRTQDGSLSDLEPQPDLRVWDRARSEHDNCMGRRCATYEKCFFQRARRRAEHAQLLIVNHALFFSDLALRAAGASLLPNYDFVVLDEAHTVENVAGDHFGITVSHAQIEHLLNTLHNDRTRKGVLAGMKKKGAVDAVNDTRRAGEAYFDALLNWQTRFGRSNGRLNAPLPVENTVSAALRQLAVVLRGVRSDLEDENDRMEISSQTDRADALAQQLEAVAAHSHEDWVYWLATGSPTRTRVSLHARPIDLCEMLKTHLFDRIPSVVLTSATLATSRDDDFAYIRQRVGLTGGASLQLGSPFDYASQMTVRVEAALPEPSAQDAFIPAACEAIARHVKDAGGRTLVLFTSYALLRACATRLAPVFAECDIELLVHGEQLSRSAILDRFREDRRSVIFGTDSFWEGVDVPGDALTTVIITKLPFAAPDRPDVEARIEHIRKRGGEPFRTFQLPEAILKFKQGVGRLIRSKRDRGTIVVLDSRIVAKSYGSQFLTALPPCNTIIDPPLAPRTIVRGKMSETRS